MQQFREVSRPRTTAALKHIKATLYYVLKWEASADFPGEV